MKLEQAVRGQFLTSYGGKAMKERLKKCWESEEGCDHTARLESMSPRKLFEEWMVWEGFICNPDSIIRALRESGYVVEEVEK